MNGQSRPDEPVTVGRDGISVAKSLVTDEFPVPTVELVLTSTRADEATVRLREYVPDGFSLESIGFHADYGSEYWTAYQDNRIEFERTLAPGEEVRTIYGLRVADDEQIAAFLGEPELVSVNPVDEEPATDAGSAVDEIVDRDRNDALRSMLGDDEPAETEAVDPDSEPEPDPELDPEPEPDATEAPAPEPEPATPTDADEPAMTEPAASPSAMPGSVAEALAEELRAGEVDADDRDLIRTELGLDLSRSTEERFRHLQGRVEDMLAYSEPVSAFIDDGGPERLADLEETVLELTESIDRLSSRVDDLDTDQGDALADLETTVAAIDERLDDLDDRLDETDEAVSDLVEWRGQLGEMFGGSRD